MSIIDSFNIALSGMQAASTEMDVAASNIANLQSPGYKAQQANLSSLPNDGGVSVASITADPSRGPIDAQGQQGTNVDLANQMFQLSRAKTLYNANADVVRVAYQLTGTLLDMFDETQAH